MIEEFFGGLRRLVAGEGERQLMIAVLEDAVDCFQSHLFANDKRGQRLFDEAEEWLMAENTGASFSLRNVCEVLEIQPEYIRNGLEEWRARQPRIMHAGGDAQGDEPPATGSEPPKTETGGG